MIEILAVISSLCKLPSLSFYYMPKYSFLHRSHPKSESDPAEQDSLLTTYL